MIEGGIARICVIGGIIVGSLGLCVSSVYAEPGSKSGIVNERAVVKTRTLYRFPEHKEVRPPACPPATSGPTPEEYLIGPGDVLEIQIVDDAAAPREVSVRYDGHVSLPYIEDQNVSGLGREAALERIRDAYRAVFRDPKLTLTVKDSSSKRFFVIGNVEKPDKYPYERPLSVLEAVYTAGGPRIESVESGIFIGAQGQLSKACILRRQNGERCVLEYDLSGLCKSGENPADAPVLPGDVVYVPEGVNLVYVMGEVLRPSVYPLTEGTTLLELLARAGGALERSARMRSVVLLRQVDEEKTEAMQIDLRKALKTGFSPRLRPGDIIYIPRGRLVRLYDNLMRFTRLTETVSPLLDLYMQAYDAYYTEKTFDLLFDDDTCGALGIPVLESLGIIGR